MQTYHILQGIVFSYTALVAVLALVIMFFEIKNSFKTGYARFELFEILNKLHGKKTVLLPLQIFSFIFLFSWLALALPLADTFSGLHAISDFTNVDGYTGISTWFGIFTDKGNQAGYYFLTVFVSILGAKGFWLVKRISDILYNDHLAVNRFGAWGGKRDFDK